MDLEPDLLNKIRHCSNSLDEQRKLQFQPKEKTTLARPEMVIEDHMSSLSGGACFARAELQGQPALLLTV